MVARIGSGNAQAAKSSEALATLKTGHAQTATSTSHLVSTYHDQFVAQPELKDISLAPSAVHLQSWPRGELNKLQAPQRAMAANQAA